MVTKTARQNDATNRLFMKDYSGNREETSHATQKGVLQSCELSLSFTFILKEVELLPENATKC